MPRIIGQASSNSYTSSAGEKSTFHRSVYETGVGTGRPIIRAGFPLAVVHGKGTTRPRESTFIQDRQGGDGSIPKEAEFRDEDTVVKGWWDSRTDTEKVLIVGGSAVALISLLFLLKKK